MFKQIISVLFLVGTAQGAMISAGSSFVTPALSVYGTNVSAEKTWVVDVLTDSVLRVYSGTSSTGFVYDFPAKPGCTSGECWSSGISSARFYDSLGNYVFVYRELDGACGFSYGCNQDTADVDNIGIFPQTFSRGRYFLSIQVAEAGSVTNAPVGSSIVASIDVREGQISVNEAPEPGTWALLALPALLLWNRRSRNGAVRLRA